MKDLFDFILEKRDNALAKETPGIPGDNLDTGSYWWKTAEDMLYDLKKFLGNNTKKIMTSKFEEAIKKCYKDVPENPTFKDVPFVVKLDAQNVKSNKINPAQIYIRRNITYKDDVKQILQNWGISQEGSGFGKSAGNEYEDALALAIQKFVFEKYILKKKPENSSINNFISNLFMKLNPKYNLDKILKSKYKNANLDEIWFEQSKNGEQIGKIKEIVAQTGGSNTHRNKNGEIIDIKKMKFNYSNEAEVLDENTLSKISQTLKNSGKIISDITIFINDPKSSDNIYLSVKHGSAQLSGISVRPPFYDNLKKSLDYSKQKNDDSFESFNNLCDIFGVERKTCWNYFSQQVQNREEKLEYKPKTFIDLEDNNMLAASFYLLIGGNYWYVNSDGHIRYFDWNIKKNPEGFDDFPIEIKFEGKSWLTPKSLNREVKITRKDNSESVKGTLRFRSSSENDEYPCRFFWDIAGSENWVDKLFPEK